MSTYYAYVDKADTDDENNIYIEFHCLPVLEERDWTQLQRDEFRNVLLENKVPSIFLSNTISSFRELFNFFQLPGDLESDWYLLSTNVLQDGLLANIFADENDAGTVLFIGAVTVLPIETVDVLNSLTSIDDVADAGEKDILAALNRNSGSNAEFIAVYNVGQGNCNAVCFKPGRPLSLL